MIYRLIQFVERQHAIIRIPAIYILFVVLSPIMLVRYIFA
jgi:hypothetical protein